MEASASAAMDSGCSTPYMTAPSSPPRFFSQFGHNPSLKDANFTLPPPSSSSTSSSPKHFLADIDFAFSFAGEFHDAPLSAEDLFHHGKIKPFKSASSTLLQTESETEELNNDGDGVVFKTANSSPRRRNVFHDAFASPRKRKDIDLAPSSDDDDVRIKGRSAKREFKVDETSPFKHTKARSLPPFQLSQMLDEDDEAKQSNVKTASKTTATASFWTTFSLTRAYRKWKLKDLLFRSASEGRSTDKVAVDPALMNYAVLTKSKSREATAASFRSSSDGASSMKGSGRRSRGVPVSAHELHYTVNRAVAEEMKRKTFLPYKQSLLGCLGFNPGGHPFQGRAGSMTRV